MKVLKPSLRYKDEKLEKDLTSHFMHVLINSFLTYLISLIIFLIVDITIESSYGYISQEIGSRILHGSAIIFGFLISLPRFRHSFDRNFFIYYYFLLATQLVSIYIEKSNNDTKICMQNIVIFSYAIFIANKQFYKVIFGVIIYFIILIPE